MHPLSKDLVNESQKKDFGIDEIPFGINCSVNIRLHCGHIKVEDV